MMRKNHKMNARTIAQWSPKVGLPMTIAINARAVKAKEMITMVTSACKVGFVVILKANFMPVMRTKATGGSVEVDSGWSLL